MIFRKHTAFMRASNTGFNFPAFTRRRRNPTFRIRQVESTTTNTNALNALNALTQVCRNRCTNINIPKPKEKQNKNMRYYILSTL